MDYDLIVVKTLERVYKNYYYIIHNTRRDVFIVLKKYIFLTYSYLYYTSSLNPLV